MYIIAADNGVSGSIAVLDKNGLAKWWPTPVKKDLNYTKKKAWLNRIDTVKLAEILNPYRDDVKICALERPMINPMRWNASVSAIRALEATLIVIEGLRIPFRYIDSREWQKTMLPAGLKGSDELKAAADSVCHRLFPAVEICKGGGDSLLIAKYLKDKEHIADACATFEAARGRQGSSPKPQSEPGELFTQNLQEKNHEPV